MEKWKQIPGFLDYEASTSGRIRSARPRKGSRARVNGGIIEGWIQEASRGYQRRCVAFRKDGKTFIKKVHRIVLETFVGPCPDGMGGLHNNGDSLDNRLSNLRWGTQSENVADSAAHGTQKPPPVLFGEKHHNTTISTADVMYIRAQPQRRGLHAELARQFGVPQITISRIYSGVTRANG